MPVIASERSYVIEKEKFVPVSEYYGEDTFNLKVLKVKLPRKRTRKSSRPSMKALSSTLKLPILWPMP